MAYGRAHHEAYYYMKKPRQKERSDDLVGIGIPATKFPAYEPMMTAYLYAEEEELVSSAREVKVT